MSLLDREVTMPRSPYVRLLHRMADVIAAWKALNFVKCTCGIVMSAFVLCLNVSAGFADDKAGMPSALPPIQTEAAGATERKVPPMPPVPAKTDAKIRTQDGVDPLQADPGVTAIAGRVVTLEGVGLAGASVADGPVTTTTDAQGRYLLAGVPAGDSVIALDARHAGPGQEDYGFYNIRVSAVAGQTTALPYNNWLPKIDHAHEVTIPSPTTAEVVVTHPDLPGLELHIPAGTIFTDADHKPVTKISMTPIPNDRTPFPLPKNVTIPEYFTIQPGDATATGVAGNWVGAQLWYPNDRHELPGARGTFWRYDAFGVGWTTYGTGTVSKDGQHFIPDPETRLYDLTGAMFGGNTPPDKGSPPPGTGNDPGPCPNCTCGDPVDPSTGLWNETFVDLAVADVTPLSVVRTWRQNDPNRRSFGIGMTLSYDMYLYSPSGYMSADLITPAGGRIHFVRTSTGTGWTDAALTSTSNPGPFYNATLVWNGAGWNLTTQDGMLYVFADNAPLQYFQDRFGNRVTLTRATPTGPITTVSSSNGRWIKFTYGTNNVITSATDNTGRTVNYGYDAGFNYLQTVTDPNGGITTFNWDTANNRITSIQYPRQNPAGPVAMTTAFDANGRVQSQTLLGNVAYTFAYTLDGSGNVTATDITMTDSNYTPTPRTTVCKFTFNAAGYWTSNKQAFGQTIEQDYTAVRGGDPIPAACTLNTAANSPTNALIALTDGLNRTTCWTYSVGGKILTETRLAGTANAVTTTYTYGAYNQLASVQDPLSHATTFGLDSLGRLTSITDALSHQWTVSPTTNGQIGSITDPLTHATSFTYDHGDLATVTDALSRVSLLYTDALGRTIRASDPRANLWQWSYDPIWGVHIATDANANAVTTNYNADGLVSSVVDPRSSTFTTQYAYDTKDRLITRTDPLNHNDTINTFDGFNNPRTTTDRKSQNVTYGYDLLGRIVSATLADGHSLVYTWDKGNRLTEVDDTLSGTTNKVIRVFDGLDRLTSETVMQGATTIGAVTYTYDAASRRATMNVPGQTQLCYVFDNANRLTSITQGTGANCATGLVTLEAFTYDNANCRATVTLPNGIVGTYGYDNANELLSITYTKGATTVGDLTYSYDTAGRIATRGGSLFKSALPAATTAAAVYNADNQLTSWNGTTISYDLNGNLSNDGTRSFTWDARNRLTAIGSVASFVYDGVGRRQSVTQGATTVTALYDGYDPVQEQSPTGTVSANLQIGLGVDERFSRTKSGTTSTYLADLLGSTVALADSAGTVQTSYSYDPYGATTQSGAANDNQYQFTGRQNDGTGLYYYRARYYNPVWGRFVNEDPIGLRAGINLYAYAAADPVGFADSLGLCAPSLGDLLAANPWLIPAILGTEIAGGGPEDPIADAAVAAEVAAAEAEAEAAQAAEVEAQTTPTSSQYINSTAKGAEVTNRTTDVNAENFARNLTENGYNKTYTSPNGNAETYTSPGGDTYTIRPSNTAPGGKAADYTPAGSTGPTLKINLGK
jgi:RHS repeat-associated protein